MTSANFNFNDSLKKLDLQASILVMGLLCQHALELMAKVKEDAKPKSTLLV